jgi:intracellular sulfur oxidation DsrE/DsrF family protein
MQTRIVFGSCLLTLVSAVAAFGQRGVGGQTGVARQANKPELVAVNGKVEGVKTGPCEMTTGRAEIGTHLLLKTAQGTELNIHLGPADAVESMVKGLSQGTRVTVLGFRTNGLPEGQYVAQSLKYGDTTIRLRDEQLRPVWAGADRSRPRATRRRLRAGGQVQELAETAGTYDDPITLAERQSVKVVYQIKTDGWKKDMAAGLYYLAKLSGAYDEIGIEPPDRQIVGVFHGDAGYFLLKDTAYRKASEKSDGNPNKQIIRKLLDAGVKLELCKSTMQSHGWTGDDVLPGVKIVVGAYPRIIDLQLRGYAYVRF